MENNQEDKPIVIATLDCQRALYVIGKCGMAQDKITINYVDKFAPTIEYLLRMLRKSFGWLEVARGTDEVENTRCRYNVNGLCTHKELKPDLQCKETVRANCDHFDRKYSGKIFVNTVTIEKAGGIRGL